MEDSSLRYRNATQRRESIISALLQEGFLSISDLVHDLGVSHMTIRRDLQHLERAGHARMVYGGASLSLSGPRRSGTGTSGTVAGEARIGRCAATLVGRAETIAIDAGRLGYEVAKALPEHFRGMVVTHSIPVIQLLTGRSPATRVVGLGGEVTADSCAFVGAGTLAAIEGMRVGTLFLSADSLDDRGAYARSDAEASVKRALLRIADRTVLLARHECFTDSAPLLLGPLVRIDTVVTDRQPPSRLAHALRRADVPVLVAGDRRAESPGGQSVPVGPLPTR